MKALIAGAFVAAGALAAPLLHAETCNPISRDTCAVPFPSDFWTTPDGTSPTGRTLSVPDGVLRKVVFDQLPAADGFTPSQIFNGASGFSAGTAVIFEFNARPMAESLPPDGGEAVIAWNLTRGEPVEIRAAISEYAASDKVSEPYRAIEVFPVSRWNFGERILVAATRELDVPGDDATDVSTLCAGAVPGTKHGDYCADLIGALADAGFAANEALTATVFTVRDRGEVLGPMRNAVDTAWNGAHPVRNLKTHYDVIPGNNIAAVVRGEVRLDSYRTKSGAGNVDLDAAPQHYWTTFRLTLPKASIHGSVPVVFYTHGLGLLKESDLLVSRMNAALGMATFSIDFPNHGERSLQDGGYVLTNLSTERVATQIGMVNQATIDFAAAHKALVSELAGLDVLSKPTWYRWCWACSDGKPDIDPTRVMMQGTSLGGVLGAAYASLGHDLEGALFHVTGVGITSILSGSTLWDGFFSNLVPSAANGSEALVLRAAVQHAMDYADAINYLDLLRNPDVPRAARPMMIITGEGDSLVPNYSSTAAARIAGLPLVGEGLYPMVGVMQQPDYDGDGFGVRQYPPLLGGEYIQLGDFITNASAHVIFLRFDAIGEQMAWMDRFMFD